MKKVEIVAEIGASHAGKLENALELIKTAKECGADAVKIQTWDKETMAHPYLIRSGLWVGRDLVDLYNEAHTPWEWHKDLFDYAKEIGIELFSSVFDLKSLEFLESLSCPRYKISSFELCDLTLIGNVIKTGKPIIISTGMASKREILKSLELAFSGRVETTLLKCTSAYPAKECDMNIKAIKWLKAHCANVGLSDHTKGTMSAIMSVAIGVEMIEKHIKLSNTDCLDKFALCPIEFKKFADSIRNAEECMGNDYFFIAPDSDENESRSLRRSVYATKDVAAGYRIGQDDLVTMRPNLGDFSDVSDVIGRIAVKRIKKGSPILEDQLSVEYKYNGKRIYFKS